MAYSTIILPPPESLFLINGDHLIYDHLDEWGVPDTVSPVAGYPNILWVGSDHPIERREFYGKFLSDAAKFFDAVMREQWGDDSAIWKLPDIGAGLTDVAIEDITDATFDGYPMQQLPFWKEYRRNIVKLMKLWNPLEELTEDELLDAWFGRWLGGVDTVGRFANQGRWRYTEMVPNVWPCQPVTSFIVRGTISRIASKVVGGEWSAGIPTVSNNPSGWQKYLTLVGPGAGEVSYGFSSRYRMFFFPVRGRKTLRQELGLKEGCVLRTKIDRIESSETWLGTVPDEFGNYHGEVREDTGYDVPLAMSFLWLQAQDFADYESYGSNIPDKFPTWKLYDGSALQLGILGSEDTEFSLDPILDLEAPDPDLIPAGSYPFNMAYFVFHPVGDFDVSDLATDTGQPDTCQSKVVTTYTEFPEAKGELPHYYIVYPIVFGGSGVGPTTDCRLGTPDPVFEFIRQAEIFGF